jgi:4-hydroxy-4-methyl-2-oxoglutarate aldolase
MMAAAAAAAAAIAQARHLGAATLHEAFERQGDLPAAIRAIGSARVAGPALTVATQPGNNLLIHRALAQARPGDVLVVALTDDADGGHDFGYWGDILTTAAQARGVAGLVIDGCVRDVEAIRTLGFPVFCRGTAIRGTGKAPVGTVGATVRIGRIAIAAGDLIVGDADGVVAVPSAQVAQVLAAAEQREAKENAIVAALKAGKTTMELYGFEA